MNVYISGLQIELFIKFYDIDIVCAVNLSTCFSNVNFLGI
jgi:hypothetical protein